MKRNFESNVFHFSTGKNLENWKFEWQRALDYFDKERFGERDLAVYCFVTQPESGTIVECVTTLNSQT